MNILTDTFCVSVSNNKERQLYINKADLIFNKFRNSDNQNDVNFDYYKVTNMRYVGYFNGRVGIDNKAWDPMISAEAYSNYVDEIMGTTFNDNYEIF